MKRVIVGLAAWLGSVGWAVPANTYTVPVEEALTSMATFEVPDAVLRFRRGGRLTLEYTLPDLLAGAPGVKVEASGRWKSFSGPQTLKSKFGVFICEWSKRGAQCQCDYDRAAFAVLQPEGLEPARQYVMEKMTDPTEQAERLLVLEAFSHEAAGKFENLRVRLK